jgi:branched-chain amino acid transport system substrate-binding protein
MKKLVFAGVALTLGMALSGMARADITIGVAGPFTGSLASFGDQLKAGAVQAAADINAAGGVNGQQIVLEFGDDQCDPKQAVSVAEQMAAKKVPFVLGHFCSGSSIPASGVYNDAGIVQISAASTNPAFTDQRPGPGAFRVCGRDDQQGIIAGNFLASHFKDKKIAIIDDKSAYGKGLADETRKNLNAAGVKEVMDESYNAGEKDYTALVSKLKEAGIEVLYVGGYHPEAGLIKRQMKDQGMTTILVSGDALVTAEYWQITGDAGEGTLMTFSPDPRKDKANDALNKTFRDKGVEPEGYVYYAYAALQVWAAAANTAKSTDFQKVVDALNSGTFKTVLGDLKFDAKGDVTLPGYVFYEWKAGKYDYIKS